MSAKAFYRRHAPENFIRAVDTFRQNRHELSSCLNEIRSVFPELRIVHARLVTGGFDHAIAEINKKYVFRFPRTRHYQSHLDLEISVLNTLQTDLLVRVPRYDFVAPATRFGGYLRVPGVEMTPRRFASLGRARQREVARQFVDFLNRLHATPPGLLAPRGGPAPTLWESLRYGGNDHLRRRPVLAAHLTNGELAALDGFFARFAKPAPAVSRVVHGDLVHNHFLLDSAGRLGVIDFGELALGDPAWDFAVMASYGDWIGPYMFERYAFAAQDPDLLSRAKIQAVRFWTARLFRALGKYRNDHVADLRSMVNACLETVRQA